jgi:esterase/lipase superfamily enzyme
VGAIDASKPEDRAEIESLGAKVVDVTAYSDADRFISHAVFANSPQVIGAIGSQIAAPRPEDANAVSVIDATKYQDPSPAPIASTAPSTAVQSAPLPPAAGAAPSEQKPAS